MGRSDLSDFLEKFVCDHFPATHHIVDVVVALAYLERYKKNLVGLVVFRATPVLHTFFDFAKLFLSPKVPLVGVFLNGNTSIEH